MTQKIVDWLTGFAGLGRPGIDALGPGAGWAIFPKGQKVILEKEDILGSVRQRIRAQWTVKLHVPREDASAAESLLEALALWVRADAPVLGTEQTVRVENARLSAQSGDHIARYDADLIAEFTL